MKHQIIPKILSMRYINYRIQSTTIGTYPLIDKIPFKMILIFCALFVSFSMTQSVFAASVSFSAGTYTLNDGTPTSPVIITVTDSLANIDPFNIDTVSITVTSNTDTSGITLILYETGVNTGIFQNTNLIFTTGNAQYQITDTATISISDSSQNTNINGIDSTTVDVISTSDNSGISFSLSETSINSGIFKGTLAFTSGSSSGNAIMVSGGDVVSVKYPPSSEITNVLIIPNPNLGVGSLKATVGDTITATYQGINDFAIIISSGPGGGGGGPIRAGLVLDFILGFGGCPGDCFPPTLGVTRNGERLVDNGFSYNGNSTDVEQYYTPYPLITVEVGKLNVAKLKIFENSGKENIRHVELGFGLGKGQVISESKAVIEYNINFDGTTQTKLFDPYHVLDNVTVTSQPTKCKLEEENENCMEFSFYHVFRESLDFNMVGTNIWDHKRNGWQNYYNHGIEIVGDSLNPPKQIQVLDRLGYQKTLTITDKDIGIDEDGALWYEDDNIWKTEYIIPARNDPITTHGIDRNNNKFYQHLQDEALRAQNTFEKITQNKTIQNTSFGLNDNLQIKPDYVGRMEDKELQKTIMVEMKKAEELYKRLWPKLFITN